MDAARGAGRGGRRADAPRARRRRLRARHATRLRRRRGGSVQTGVIQNAKCKMKNANDASLGIGGVRSDTPFTSLFPNHIAFCISHFAFCLTRSPPESHPDGDVVGPAAQIDLRPGEPLVEVRFGTVITDLAAGADGFAAKAQAGNHDGAGLTAFGDVLIPEDFAIPREVDELARFAVPPPDDAETGAKVWLQGVRLAQRQHPDGERYRYEPKPQVLFDLGAVAVGEIGVDAGHRTPGEPDARPRFDKVAQRHEPLGADGRAPEVADVERKEAAVRVEDIALGAGVLAARCEQSEGKIQRLLGRRVAGRDEQPGACEQKARHELFAHVISPELTEQSSQRHPAGVMPARRYRIEARKSRMTASISSWTLPFEATRCTATGSRGEPSMPVMRPPASATIRTPAATSHGFRCCSQKASNRPAAT